MRRDVAGTRAAAAPAIVFCSARRRVKAGLVGVDWYARDGARDEQQERRATTIEDFIVAMFGQEVRYVVVVVCWLRSSSRFDDATDALI